MVLICIQSSLPVPLKEVTRRALEELTGNPADLWIPADIVQSCGVTPVEARHFVLVRVLWRSWSFVVVHVRGNEAVRVIGCASGRVGLDKSHPEHMCGIRLTNNVGELQAMCCAVLWLAEQAEGDDSMRKENTFRQQICSGCGSGTCSGTHRTLSWCTNSGIHWHCVNGSVVGRCWYDLCEESQR